MAKINQNKAELMYRVLDSCNDFYRGRVEGRDRSLMNVTFNLANPEIEKQFLAEAQAAGFSGLAGHRSTGGVRASLYNGLTLEAVEQLVGFMEDFWRQHRQ